MFGLEGLSPQQDMVTWLQLGAPHPSVMPSFMMFGLLVLHFLDQIISQMQFVFQLACIVMVSLVKLFIPMQSKQYVEV